MLAFLKQTNYNYHGYYWQLDDYITWIIGLPCWLLGVLIAENIDHLKTMPFSKVLAYRLIVYLTSCFCCFGKFHLHLSYLLSMNIFALLLYKWIQAEIVYYKSRQPNQSFEKMGKFSYSLYLCHPVVFLLLKRFIIFNNFTYPFFVLLTIVAAYLFYLVVERPSHRLARKINQKYFLKTQ
jgi:peptidoglycan/LPS O-acetylase OafA/YrhL